MQESYKSGIGIGDVWREMKSRPAELARAAVFDGYGALSNVIWPLELADPLTGAGQTAYIFFKYGKDLGGWKWPVAALSFVEEATPFVTDWFPTTLLSYGMATYRRMKKEAQQEANSGPVAISQVRKI